MLRINTIEHFSKLVERSLFINFFVKYISGRTQNSQRIRVSSSEPEGFRAANRGELQNKASRIAMCTQAGNESGFSVRKPPTRPTIPSTFLIRRTKASLVFPRPTVLVKYCFAVNCLINTYENRCSGSVARAVTFENASKLSGSTATPKTMTRQISVIVVSDQPRGSIN